MGVLATIHKSQLIVVAAAAAMLLFFARQPKLSIAPAAPRSHNVAFRADLGSEGGPVARVIVQDLTLELVKSLREQGMKTLLALAAKDDAQLKLQWQTLHYAGIKVAFAPTRQQLLMICKHNLTEADTASVALLIKSPEGTLRLQQSQLAMLAERILQGALGLTAAYGIHSSKGDSLIIFGLDGTPLSAAFLATNIFRDKFSDIYDSNYWGGGDKGGGGSGPGSNMDFTRFIRGELPAFIARYNISSMLDSSCGSMHWMPLVLENVSQSQPNFKFMGTDVACSLISNHTAKFAAKKNWKFACVDYANQPLPKGYQLIWSRDSLQHLPLHAVWMFLNNVRATGTKYLLVGSYIKEQSERVNMDIPAGSYFPIDLMRPPFSVGPEPIEILDEQTVDKKHMLLFDVAKMTWQDELYGLV